MKDAKLKLNKRNKFHLHIKIKNKKYEKNTLLLIGNIIVNGVSNHSFCIRKKYNL